MALLGQTKANFHWAYIYRCRATLIPGIVLSIPEAAISERDGTRQSPFFKGEFHSEVINGSLKEGGRGIAVKISLNLYSEH
jgi:hypothetical protein